MQSSSSSSSWVDHISFRPISHHHNDVNDPRCSNGKQVNDPDTSNTNSTELSVSIICWNVLAEGYCSRKSHPGLPRQYQEVVFDKSRRGSLIRKILCSGKKVLSERTETELFGNDSDDNEEAARAPCVQLLADMWTLQEVDMDEVLSKHLACMGYEGIETPRMKIGSGAGGKADSCGVYWRSDRWSLVDQELIRLDDLASLPATDDDDNNNDSDQALPNGDPNAVGSSTIGSINNNLQGLQRSFLRRNVAVLVRLQSKQSPQTTLVLAATHLFWNPIYEYVKLCQMHYIMIRAKKFRKNDAEPFVVCGDLNSLPGSSVHEYLTKGHVNAKFVAPWYREGAAFVDDEEVTGNQQNGENLNGLSQDMSSLKVSPQTNGNETLTKKPSNANGNHIKPQHSQQVRYLLDVNLNRLCRWFRILGLDAGLETESEERLRTKEANIKLFERCRKERRVLITTSSTLLARTNCPAGTYLVNPKCLQGNWEIILAHILLTHGVVLDPHKFLSRCVVCNGNICTVTDPELKAKIFADYQAPVDGDEDLAVFQCNGCQQGYWWCDRPTSSASRVKCQATKLYQMCLQANVPISPSTEQHIFNHLDVETEKGKGWDWTMKGSELLKLKLQVTEWLRDRHLTCPISDLESAYKDESNESGESIPFSNMTSDFEGLLDYIFFNRSCTPTHRLYVPSTYEELNQSNMSTGHLLPSNVWPSDHLAIGVVISISNKSKLS